MHSFISPECEIRVWRPYDARPIVVPSNLLSTIESTRGFDGGSISLSFPGNGKVAGIPTVQRIQELFADQSLVDLRVRRTKRDRFRQINLGYVAERSQTIAANGAIEYRVDIRSLDQKLRSSELLIDRPDEEKQDSAPKRSEGNTIERAFARFSDVVREMRRLPDLVRAIWNELIVELLFEPAVSGRALVFGGNRLFARTGEDADAAIRLHVFDGAGYSENFVHILHLADSFSFGERVNFWEALESVKTDPLYELFCDPLEGEADDYKVAPDSVTLVFRKTPFETLFDDRGFYRAPANVREVKSVSRISVSTVNAELYCGVHVSPTILDAAASTVLLPPTVNRVLRGIHSFKLMDVKLAGVGIPADAKKAERLSLIDGLRIIQRRLYTIFCGGTDGETAPLRNTTGTVECSFDYYRAGTLVSLPDVERRNPVRQRFWNRWKGEGGPASSEAFGRFAYVTGVTDRFAPKGEAKTTLNIKWIDRLE